jgi:hypothetical protein
MPIGQIPDLRGQLLGGGHLRPSHQNGRDRYIALERRFDLHADEITGSLQSDPSPFVLCRGPVLVDNDQHEVAGRQCFLQFVAKIATQRNAVHVHEYGALAEPRRKLIEQSPSLAGSGLPSVTDEDRAHATLVGIWRMYSKQSACTVVCLVTGQHNTFPART